MCIQNEQLQKILKIIKQPKNPEDTLKADQQDTEIIKAVEFFCTLKI